MPPVHAFFDFDDTLLRGDSILYWQRWYYSKRPLRRGFQLLNWAGLLLHALRLVDSHFLKRLFLMPLAYEEPEVLDALARDFVREDLARRFHAPVLERLWAHHRLGHKVVIISASATFYLDHLKTLLPMAEILGSEMVWPRKGLWRLPRYTDFNLRGANKLVRLKARGYGDRSPLAFGYSDHHHDAHLLGFTDFPCAVRPSRKLRALASERGWPVLDWPREAPAWREKLGKALLLVAAAGPASLGRASEADAVRQSAEADRHLREHGPSLRARVAAVFPEDRHPEVFRAVFGSGAGAGAGDIAAAR
jgi:HAD superfamily phosphoserine phosphatase-like hydrolase